MPIDPGRTDGGRPKVGPYFTLALPDETHARIDQLVAEAHRRYDRVPREYRTRSALVRACIHDALGAHSARIHARPEPEDEGS